MKFNTRRFDPRPGERHCYGTGTDAATPTHWSRTSCAGRTHGILRRQVWGENEHILLYASRTNRMRSPDISDTGTFRITDDDMYCSKERQLRNGAETCQTTGRPARIPTKRIFRMDQS